MDNIVSIVSIKSLNYMTLLRDTLVHLKRDKDNMVLLRETLISVAILKSTKSDSLTYEDEIVTNIIIDILSNLNKVKIECKNILSKGVDKILRIVNKAKDVCTNRDKYLFFVTGLQL